MLLNQFDFRIWDRKYNTFLKAEHDYLCIAKKDNHYDYERILDVVQDCSGFDIVSFDDYTDNRYEIELWTGYYDQFDKKIYDGDIVRVLTPDDEYLILVDFLNNTFVGKKGKRLDEHPLDEVLLGEFDYDICEYKNIFKVLGTYKEHSYLIDEQKI